MNTLQVSSIIKLDKRTSKIYLGTFAFDKLPTIVNYPSCLIVNTQKSNQLGEHWLAIYYSKNKSCYFFDSMGLPPTFYKLEQYIKLTSKSYTHNKKQLQGIFSQYCGYYCINFLLIKSRNIGMKHFYKFFNNTPKENDQLIKRLIDDSI